MDAAQGVEAQTLANVNLAYQSNLALIPVINKIDLPAADPERVREEIENVLALDASDAVLASAKAGIGIVDILEQVVEQNPAAFGRPGRAPPRPDLRQQVRPVSRRGLVMCAWWTAHIKSGQKIRFMATGKEFEVIEVGTFAPGTPRRADDRHGRSRLCGGQHQNHWRRERGRHDYGRGPPRKGIAWQHTARPSRWCFAACIRLTARTIPNCAKPCPNCRLNDAALCFEAETSAALGFGFRCGFLGLLHMDVIQERLEREFDLSLIATCPSVIYKVHRTDGKIMDVDNPAFMPNPTLIDFTEEPFVDATVILPKDYVGTIMELCRDRRGEFVSMEYPSPERVMLRYKIPLSEILMDFFDQLKSRTKGYASFDYELSGYRDSKLVKIDIQMNGDPVDALSFITHRDKAYERAKLIVEKLKEVVPRQQYEVRIQAAIGGKIISAETVKAFRKNVIAKCYGGDITRKRKLLEKQKEGKKRMKSVGSIEIPQEAFLSVLKLG